MARLTYKQLYDSVNFYGGYDTRKYHYDVGFSFNVRVNDDFVECEPITRLSKSNPCDSEVYFYRISSLSNKFKPYFTKDLNSDLFII